MRFPDLLEAEHAHRFALKRATDSRVAANEKRKK